MPGRKTHHTAGTAKKCQLRWEQAIVSECELCFVQSLSRGYNQNVLVGPALVITMMRLHIPQAFLGHHTTKLKQPTSSCLGQTKHDFSSVKTVAAGEHVQIGPQSLHLSLRWSLYTPVPTSGTHASDTEDKTETAWMIMSFEVPDSDWIHVSSEGDWFTSKSNFLFLFFFTQVNCFLQYVCHLNTSLWSYCNIDLFLLFIIWCWLIFHNWFLGAVEHQCFHRGRTTMCLLSNQNSSVSNSLRSDKY